MTQARMALIERIKEAEVEARTGATKGARAPLREKQYKRGALMDALRDDVLAWMTFS